MDVESIKTIQLLVGRRVREQIGARVMEFLIERGLDAELVVHSDQGDLLLELKNGAVLIEERKVSPAEFAAQIESTSPEVASDIRSRSPQEVTTYINMMLAILQTIQIMLGIYQMVHQQPPTPTQVNQIINQTTNIVINMPPPGYR